MNFYFPIVFFMEIFRSILISATNFTDYNECKSYMFQNFSEYFNRKDISNYSPLIPSYNQALMKISENSIENGKVVSNGFSSHKLRNRAMISPETPLHQRALCSFNYVINFNPLRLPSTLIEAKCSEKHPPQKFTGERIFECEPLQYKMRVLLFDEFDESCGSFKEHEETISLACIPVLQAKITAAENMNITETIMVPVHAVIPI